MEAVGSFKIVVYFYNATWHHIPDNSILRGQYYENCETPCLCIFISAVYSSLEGCEHSHSGF